MHGLIKKNKTLKSESKGENGLHFETRKNNNNTELAIIPIEMLISH